MICKMKAAIVDSDNVNVRRQELGDKREKCQPLVAVMTGPPPDDVDKDPVLLPGLPGERFRVRRLGSGRGVRQHGRTSSILQH